MKKYLAEMIGTMVLVFIGCGSAIFNGGCGTPAQVFDGSDSFWRIGCGYGIYHRWHIGLPY